LKPCGSAESGLTEAASRQIRSALDAGRPVVVEVEHRGFTPDGELRHPVIRGWQNVKADF
jgi:bifunctional non-homologous end joining protein LigD